MSNTKIQVVIYYVIQHKPTGFYLPHRKGNRGFTWDEPRSPEKGPPRLFTRKSDAVHALNWWLQGRTGWKWEEGNLTCPGEHVLHTEAIPQRNKEEMEIVKVVVMSVPERVKEVSYVNGHKQTA